MAISAVHWHQRSSELAVCKQFIMTGKGSFITITSFTGQVFDFSSAATSIRNKSKYQWYLI